MNAYINRNCIESCIKAVCLLFYVEDFFQFFIHNKTKSTPSLTDDDSKGSLNLSKCSATAIEPHLQIATATPTAGVSAASSNQRTSAITSSRKNSMDLYEEAATILGLTCAETDDCKCLECQVSIPIPQRDKNCFTVD